MPPFEFRNQKLQEDDRHILDQLTKEATSLDHAEAEALALNGIRGARENLVSAEARLIGTIGLARHYGASWTKVGKTLDVSKQAAWERFSDQVSDITAKED